MPYSSSLTDKEWEIIEPLLPQKKQTRPPKCTKRQILDGIFYQLKNGCNWCDLPQDLPPYSTVFWHLLAVARSGSDRADDDKVAWSSALCRKKKPKWTSLLIIDSQAVKNTCNASTESKGFCHYKCTNGIKRHLAVDTLGLPFFTHCTKASVSDDRGLIELLSQNLNYFRAKPVNIPKITILHGRRVSPRQDHNRSPSPLSSNYDQNPIPTGTQTHSSRKSSPWQNGVCPDRLRRAGTPSQLVG